MNRFSDSKRSGYVTLLAVTFAFGLATLGTALAVSARSYLASATSSERAILDRISLESVAAQTLADIAAKGERPLQATKWPSVKLNDREIVIEISAPETKIDLDMDDEALIRTALEPLGVSDALGQEAGNLVAWVRDARLSEDQEDCLRRRATFGRAPEAYRIVDADMASSPAILAAGDQVDLRLGLHASADAAVLWVRARLTARQGEWMLHDYRKLKVGQGLPCPVVELAVNSAD